MIALSLVRGLGHVAQRHLLETYGSAQAVFQAAADSGEGSLSRRHAMLLSRVREGRAEAFRAAEAELERIGKHAIRTFMFGEENYPYRLAQCPDAPLLLYGWGDCTLNGSRMLAVVGSRKASLYGLDQTRKLIETLRVAAPCIVSGLAYGIDACAHTAALDTRLDTVAVLGNGLGTVYPASHRKLYDKIREQGLLLTEYPYDTPPDAYRFPQRNRIIAGLSDAVAVMEAKEKSGALITADIAFSYSRELFAYPGRTTDSGSAGCNALIAQNKASLVCQPSDILKAMRWEEASPQLSLPLGTVPVQPLPMSEDEQKLYDIIQSLSDPDVDTLSEMTPFSPSELAVMLLSMECKGLIYSLSGKRYGSR